MVRPRKLSERSSKKIRYFPGTKKEECYEIVYDVNDKPARIYKSLIPELLNAVDVLVSAYEIKSRELIDSEEEMFG